MEYSGPPRSPDTKQIMQALDRQILLAAQAVRSLWVTYATHEVSDTGDYVNGIAERGEIRRTFHVTGETTIEARFEIVNTSKHAAIVEDGHAAFHLPSQIRWGSAPRVKQGKNGPYLHIPFRHYTPTEAGKNGATRLAIRNQMPTAIYRQARTLRRKENANEGPIREGGKFVAADRYRWLGTKGSRRLTHHVDPGIHVGPEGEAVRARRGEQHIAGRIQGRQVVNPAWQSSKFHGMIKTGPPKHTRYLTVRTITPDSVGWNIPARAGKGIARKVASAFRVGPAGDDLREALRHAALELV